MPDTQRIGPYAAQTLRQAVSSRSGINVSESRKAIDAAAIAQLADEHQAGLILVGQALDDEGQATPQSRGAARLAEAIGEQTSLPVQMWDESGSTQAAHQARLAMGVSRRLRRGHLDDLAATVILQSYLDSKLEGTIP